MNSQPLVALPADFHTSVLLSHVIWWLSALDDQVNP